ncbi:MAG: ThuA domain-containing protein [Actinomycetota bacterium]
MPARRPSPRSLLPMTLALLLATVAPSVSSAQAGEPEPIRILAYSATYGFRHASITTAKQQFTALGATEEFDVTLSENPADISAKGLKAYDVVAFINATGEHPFSSTQQREFVEWLGEGHGFVGTHASADGNYYWSDYGDIVGAYFLAHPHTGVATNTVEDTTNPLVAHIPAQYPLNEEYYRFQLDPRPNVHVLTSLNRETAGQVGSVYVDHQPTTWCQEIAGGRSFYTAWGHFDASFTNPQVWQMLVQGLRWAGGRLEANCSPTVPVPTGRLQAEDAATISWGWKESSTEAGAEQVVTGILHNGYLKFEDVDLTGITKIKAHVSVETALEPRPYHYPAGQPASGGTISLKLDELFTGDCRCTATPVTASIAVGASAPGWKTLEASLTGVTGVHDVYFVFTEPLSQLLYTSRIVAPELTDYRYLMSVDWLELSPA